MEQNLECNIVNTLYFLYFGNKELVYHFERVYTEDGMRYTDYEYCYIFCGIRNPDFQVELDTYYFLLYNYIIEETSGNQHETIYMLTDYYKLLLFRILEDKRKKCKTAIEK